MAHAVRSLCYLLAGTAFVAALYIKLSCLPNNDGVSDSSIFGFCSCAERMLLSTLTSLVALTFGVVTADDACKCIEALEDDRF